MKDEGPLTPWAEMVGVAPDEAEARAAELFRRVDVPVRFEPTALRGGSRRRRPVAPRRLAIAVGLCAALGGVGVVAAAKGLRPLARWLVANAAPLVRTEPAPLRGRQSAPARMRPAPPASTAVAVPPVQPPAVTARKVPSPERKVALAPAVERLRSPPSAQAPQPAWSLPSSAAAPSPAAPVAPVPPTARPTPALLAARPPAESSLAREADLLAPALSALRNGGDARTALVRLDIYAAEFPRGILRKEAAGSRIEALMRLGRGPEALDTLEQYPFGAGARDAALLVLRGELRAGRNCTRALADFATVLAGVASGEIAERALFGQAVCEARLGRPAAASSFRTYLDRFPTGRFAASARNQLGGARAP
jgi:hypothetical protein